MYSAYSHFFSPKCEFSGCFCVRRKTSRADKPARAFHSPLAKLKGPGPTHSTAPPSASQTEKPLSSLACVPSPPFSMPASRQTAQKLTGPAARAVTQKLGADEYFSGLADVQRMLKSRSALASPWSRTDHPRMWRLEGRKKNIAVESSHQILPAWRRRAFSNERIARRQGGGKKCEAAT